MSEITIKFIVMSYIWLFIFTIKWNLIRLLSYFVSVINEKICLHNNQIPCTTIKFLAQQSNFFWPSKKNIIPCTTIKFLIYRKKIWIKFLEHLPNQCTQKKKFYILKKTLSICLAHQYQTLRLWPPTVFFFLLLLVQCFGLMVGLVAHVHHRTQLIKVLPTEREKRAPT